MASLQVTRPSKFFLNQLKRTTLFRRSYAAAATLEETSKKKKKRLVFDNRSPSLQDFLSQHQSPATKAVDPKLVQPDAIPYLHVQGQGLGVGKKFYIEVYGCQVREKALFYYHEFHRHFYFTVLDECE
jgi:hypothetical protein